MFELKKYESGIEMMNTLKRYSPNDFGVFALYGVGFWGLKEHKKAKEYLDLVLPSFQFAGGAALVEILLHLGMVETKLGNYDFSKQYLQEAQNLQPNNKLVASALWRNRIESRVNKILHFLE